MIFLKKWGKGKFFNFTSAQEIFEELRIASKGGKADYSGITYSRLRNGQGILWPCTSTESLGTKRLFEKSFAHVNEKAKMAVISIENTLTKPTPNKDYPLYLTTGRVMSHYLTGEQTRKSPSLAARDFEACLEIHPDTAETYHIAPDSLVRVTSEKGWIIVRSRFSESIRKDTVFVPFHWTDKQNVNRLVSDQLDPYCRMPGFKLSVVRIELIE
ncbi:assimilatory nitrate reductase large subunit [Gracilibacillus boraciitolerans JCM 21714]|uniref:Assimilatory nitrate reductase large subunit n=1 Tax=Gracilibacillus boraciitolerans JCM 21714 TaxID=1298598 RepID=W4VP00_9BACI|nr:assimilatory nitrate reductase large subunit [Gracilibacillus boraciitolerans JCM 21714]